MIDSHCHLDSEQFDADRDAVVERALAAGVEHMVAIGTGEGPPDLEAAIRLAEKYPCIYATVGIHPHDASKAAPEHYKQLAELLRHPKVVALGEIGLDYHYDHSPREVQERVFRHQLGQARAAKRPVIIHCREAMPDCLKILEQDWRSSGLGGIFHCFAGTLDEARQAIEMGFLISFAGNVTYPKAQNLRDVAREIALDRLLVETDSPFLAPQPYRGRRNEPAYVAEVARTIGNVRDLPANQVAEMASANFRRFFGLDHSGNRTGAVPGGLSSHF